ncbi:methionine--tRNA ligase [Oceanidesulfovibrio indonesiensis]|uniref:Methionine--tRNA ligase n=1 Tax=Oceanidesulfovibrio indonesiensis TaxID=54767 RepID=A0A7M3MJN8_9BACT|nr:methionine--tRNA ligase [Oceanidesulfovibrio indonesiensis]TVM20033.1 methionine--tRNA ligase [Oceanidesulfovibrio indonesiensis]
MERFYVTTPIYYVNAKPHLGHAYTTIVADCLNRFHKALGKDTFFLTGTDEHGDKIVQAAEENGESPKAYVDRISALFRDLYPSLDIEYDRFVRTTEPQHVETVRTILQRVYDSGDIYFAEYTGLYCYGCERFYTEKELENGLCPQHQKAPEEIRESNYFFRMSKYKDWLAEHIRANPQFIRPTRYAKEVLSLLESGELEDLCISRPKHRLEWGIELPFDSEYVCYVWFDALINYLTGVDWPDGENFSRFWPGVQHLVAKDILKPHAVFWPTMLKAAGIELYNNLNVHGYWLVDQTKMSKSLGNVVAPLDMVERYGASAFRYYLMREMHFGNDANFSEEGLVARLNADLANDLGNLFSRVLSMVHKYQGGVVPAPSAFSEEDKALMELGCESMQNYIQLFEHVEFSRALESLWEFVRAMNKYVDDMKPWALNKAGETERLNTVMYVLLEGMRKTAAFLWPVMPQAGAQMLLQLQGAFDPTEFDIARETAHWEGLAPGGALAKVSNLFPRVDWEKQKDEAPEPEESKSKKGKQETRKPKEEQPEGVAFIEFGDFQKLDLRVGTVIGGDKHPDADKLLRLEVDLGELGTRQVIAGLAEFFTPEELTGRQVVVVANLKPRKLRGLESQGMILAVRTGEGMRLLTVTDTVPNGSRVS